MKRTLQHFIVLLAGMMPLLSAAQDVPLFTQKLTNSFLYNPSVAGNTFGSLTLSHRKLWSGVQDAPTTNMISAHSPFGQHRFGGGINFYQDKIGITQTLYGSAAFAYHIKIADDKALSFGVSGEYNNLKLNPVDADVIDEDDPLLRGNGEESHVDFSFGTSFKAKYFKLGGSANRLTTLLGKSDSSNIARFPAFYTGSLQFMIPLAGDRDMLEPMVTYRSVAQGEPQIDLGLFYTFKEMATLGGSYRSGGAVNLTAAVKISKRILIGYSRDIYANDFNKGIGATNEFTLRFDFRDESFYTKTRNARAINTQAIAIRRKTLSMYSHKAPPLKQSAKYKKKVRKNGFHSPNYRMSSSKKLMTVKSRGRPGYKKRKR